MIGLPTPSPAAVLQRFAVAMDWWRCTPWLATSAATEWMHFVVVGADFRLLVNFSARREKDGVRCRVVVLYWSRGGWVGGVYEPPASSCEVRRGAIDVFMGENSIRAVEGGYALHLDPAGHGVAGDFVLRPEAPPLAATNLRLPDQGRFHWLSVPRLVVVSGGLRLPEGRSMAGAAAYHDHNWGSFSFGGDFAWEWTFGLPADARDPWSVMALQVSDRARHRTLVRGLAVWRDGHLWRDFRNEEVSFSRHGRLRGPPPHRVPEVDPALFEALASAPAQARWAARASSDSLDVVSSVATSSQIVVPTPDRLVVLSELPCQMRVQGELRGRRVDCELHGMLEVVDG